MGLVEVPGGTTNRFFGPCRDVIRKGAGRTRRSRY